MSKINLRATAAVILLALAGTTTAYAADGDNPRRDWFKKYDENNDKRWKGKEAKNFKNDHQKMYDKLQAWCEKATEKPKKFNVEFPKDVKEKKFKCKKKRIDEPYLRAWVKEGRPDRPDRDYDEAEKAKKSEGELRE